MTQSRHLVLIDTRNTSLADSFAGDGRFQSWLRSFSNMDDALRFISRLPNEHSAEVYVSEGNLSARIRMPHANQMARSLVQTFSELETIDHITVFCPKIRCVVDPQALHGVSKRLFNTPCSEFTLPARICTDGISYLGEQITLHREREETHMIRNVKDNIGELMTHLSEILRSQNQILQSWQDSHYNKPGVPPS